MFTECVQQSETFKVQNLHLFEEFVAGELYGSVRKYSDHLSSISSVETQGTLSSDHLGHRPKHTC